VCRPLNIAPPHVEGSPAEVDAAVLWPLAERHPAYWLRIPPSHFERQRHGRKYAEGEFPPDCSFYFRGPEGKLNLRVQNLQIFLQLAEGVDAETWLYHLRRGDYSNWFRVRIEDPELATEVAKVEHDEEISADDSRQRIRDLIERTYIPALPPMPMPGTDAAPLELR
jgi:hypothetical protein